MAKRFSRKDFHNEEIVFNPFQDLPGKDISFPEVSKERVSGESSDTPLSMNKCSNLLDNLLPAIQKVSLKIERKGRRGKTVTLMDVFPLPSPDASACLVKILKKTLGCGATIDGNCIIIVQGDQRKRLEKWLTEHGITNIM